MKGAASLLIAVALMGCGETARQVTIVAVKGHVTLNGTPLQDGVVSMEAPSTGFAASSRLDADGGFEMTRIPAGEFLISVNPPELAPPGETLPPRPSTMGPIRKIPAKYHVLATSGLKATVPAEGLENLVLELN